MKNKIIILLVSVFCLGCGPNFAHAIDFNLGCPGSVKVGEPLNVAVKNIKNWGADPVALSRYMAGIVVNTSNTVGSAGFYGPFAKNIAAKVVPARTPEWTPGTIPNFAVSVVKTTPDAAGTMAMVFVNFLTPDGQEIASGSCLVNIVQ